MQSIANKTAYLRIWFSFSGPLFAYLCGAAPAFAMVRVTDAETSSSVRQFGMNT